MGLRALRSDGDTELAEAPGPRKRIGLLSLIGVGLVIDGLFVEEREQPLEMEAIGCIAVSRNITVHLKTRNVTARSHGGRVLYEVPSTLDDDQLGQQCDDSTCA